MHIDWLVLVERCPAHFELYYSKNMDWVLKIWRKGCAENGSDIIICDEQDCDLSLVLAKGEVALKEWLIANQRGY